MFSMAVETALMGQLATVGLSVGEGTENKGLYLFSGEEGRVNCYSLFVALGTPLNTFLVTNMTKKM